MPIKLIYLKCEVRPKMKKYILTRDCFLGKKGDLVVISRDENGIYEWNNTTQKITGGGLSIEWEFLKRVEE